MPMLESSRASRPKMARSPAVSRCAQSRSRMDTCRLSACNSRYRSRACTSLRTAPTTVVGSPAVRLRRLVDRLIVGIGRDADDFDRESFPGEGDALPDRVAPVIAAATSRDLRSSSK
jgi:hypothetical protein